MKSKIFTLALLSMAVLSLTSCDKENAEEKQEHEMFNYTAGAYVLNDGNLAGGIAGSLDYIVPTGEGSYAIKNGVFGAVNKRTLGGTPNDVIVYGSKMYICSTDENRVEVVDKNTVKALAPSGISITQPRRFACGGGAVYVTSFDGTVSKIDTLSYKVVAKTEKIGEQLEGIAYVDGSLYVCNSCKNLGNWKYEYYTDLVQVDAAAMKKTSVVKVNTNPTQVLTDGSSLYVLSQGNYGDVKAAVEKVDVKTKAVTHLTSAANMALYAEKLYLYSIDYANNYAVKAFTYDLKTGTTADLPLASYIEYPASINVDPNSGMIYFGSYQKGQYGADYAKPGYMMVFKADGTVVGKYGTGVGPTHMAFNTATMVK